ncbi:hypothetical protein [Streptomyces bohaiensis]|uniref:hypothetical protein n=1 Tax=Streptomyces bohaiensis TaxID=1431344 RepID=UPI003B7FF8AF
MSGGQPWQPGWQSGPTPAPLPPTSRASPVPWAIALIVLLIASLAVAFTADARAGSDNSADEPGTGDLALGGLEDFRLPGGAGGPGGLGAGGGFDVPADDGAGSVSTSSPSDPTTEAFRDVRPGDCLTLFHNGIEWSTDLPWKAECEADEGLMAVTAVETTTEACPTGPGEMHWPHTAPDGEQIVLCLDRQFRVGHCMLAEQDQDGDEGRIIDGNLMSLVDCASDAAPEPWNQVMHITGVLPAPEEVTSGACARSENDATSYWHWTVNGGETLVCTMVFRG